MDPTCGLVDKFRDLVLDLIWEQLLYLVCYGQNIEQLNERLKVLALERTSIQNRIDEATNNGDQIEEKVLNWLHEVDEISEQVEQLRKEGQAKRECSVASCPNPWLRYKLSKRVKGMAKQAADILGNANFDTVSYRHPPQSMLEVTNGESNEGIDSRVPIKDQIMEALRNSSVNMIGLCGLGGVGKTTMAKEIAKNQKMFEKAIMATVSNELNIENIQGQIAEALGMQLNEKIEEVRASRLRERLKHEKNMLLILDDLWVELDLHKVGIPFLDVENKSEKNEGCKILLTSRDKALLSDNMKCQKTIEVSILSHDEAFNLFKRIAELSDDSCNPELISIATNIVRECRGLPLLIASLAKALRNKDLNVWKNALARLKNPLRRNITGIKEADAILKLSYDHLSSLEYKHIFLLASMLSHDPSIEDLLMYSMGLDFLEHIENIEDAHDELSTIVSKLKSLNLFLDSFSSHHVTMHDVIRDVALPIASKELPAFIVRHRPLNEWPDETKLEDIKGICLQESYMKVNFPEELYGPQLNFFLLNSTKRDLTIPKMFFKWSKELKVVAFIKVHFSSLSSLIYLKKLKTFCLHSCLLEDITEIRVLKNLKVLSLAYSEIQRLPVELTKLTSLQMLNLSHCSNLKVIPEKLLSSLKTLEVLCMENSFDQWKVEGSSEVNENASLDELKHLPISSLDIQIPNVSMLPENLFSHMNLKRYRILIGRRWQWQQCNHENSKILRLELERDIHLMHGVQKLLEGVEDLYLYVSNGLDKLCEVMNTTVFRQLRTLKMEHLPAFAPDACLKDGATNKVSNKMFRSLFSKVLLHMLEILELYNLNNLIPLIWDDQLSHNSFSNLKTLIVKKCGFVKLVPLHVLKYLKNLEEVEIEDCDMLEMVFDFEDLNNYIEIESSPVVVPLKKFKLGSLPKLKNVWSNHYQGNVSFPSLRSVDVSNCESLTSIFPASLAKGMLLNLEELQIRGCGIDVIVANDQASESATPAFKFPRLTSLQLSWLRKLRNFYSQRHTLECPKLERLFIDDCGALEIFSGDQVLLPKLKTLTVLGCGFVKLLPLHALKSLNNLEELHIQGCGMLEMVFDFEDLNDYEEIESSSVVVSLKTLRLFSLPKLKNVWISHYQGNVSFPSLRSLQVSDCKSLTSIFPASSLAKGMLPNLEELQISGCDIDVIVANDQASESATPTFKFPRLTSLHLSWLRKLRNFYPQRHTVEWPNLERLSIEDCGELEIFKKEVSGPLEIQEEGSTLNSNHPLLSCDQVLLPKLEILELRNLNIKQLSHNSLSNLKTLIVKECGFAKLMPFHVLKYLKNLEELEIEDCGMLEMVFDFEDLNEYKEIEPSPVDVPLKKLKLRSLPKLKNVWISHYQRKVSFPSLRSVDVDNCESLTSIFPASFIAKSMLHHLDELRIRGCGIDVIVANDLASESAAAAFEFPRLTSLELYDLVKLRNFYPKRHTIEWPNLKRLSIEDCGELEIFEKKVSSSLEIHEEESTLNSNYPILSCDQDFPNLEDLKLWGKQVKITHLFPMYHFPKVKMLDLSVQNTTISYKSSWKSFPNLGQLKLGGDFEVAVETDVIVASFSTLSLRNIANMRSLSPSLVSSQNLTHLEVTLCDQLTTLVTSSTAQCLVHLTHLSISYCYEMEEIITKQEGENDEDKEIIFNKLKVLQFDGMQRLKRFCGYNYTFRFPLLEQITITDCLKFKIFSPGLIDAPSLERVELSEYLGQHHESRDTNLNKILYQQRFLASNYVELDKDDANMIRNNQFTMESCPQVEILRIEGFVDDEWVTVPYTLLERFPKLKQLHVRDCSFEEMFPSHAPSLASFHTLKELEVSKCHQLVYLVTNSTVKSLVNLEKLEIRNCEKLEVIVKKETIEDVEGGITFKELRILTLINLPKLKTEDFNIQGRATDIGCRTNFRSLFNQVLVPKLETLELFNLLNNSISLIWEEQLLHNSFSNLKTLLVHSCGSLKWVPLHVLKSLSKLEYMHVGECDMLEMVFGFEDLDDCKEMEVVPLNLTRLSISYCQGLTTLMTSLAARSLVHLTYLSVSHCRQIKEIITKQEGEDEEDKEIIFGKLEFLAFECLPRLRRFCSHNYTLSFLLLERVTITECFQLTVFCPGTIHTPLLKNIQVGSLLGHHEDIWMTDLNDTIQHRFTIKEVISTTTAMSLNAENITMIKDVDEFPYVTHLYVESFMDEGVTFPYNSLKIFPKLEWLDVKHSSFDEIFPSHDHITDDFMEKIPTFKELHIASLDKLKNIWSDDSQLPTIHQNLEFLNVESCCNLLKLAPSSASFQCLRQLYVFGCHQLIHLVTSSTAKSLVSLQWLQIKDCKNMEEIVTNETNEDVEGRITFNRLCEIELAGMPSLKMFSSQSHTFQFPKLEKLKITGCPEMKMFCPKVLKTPKLSKVKMEEHDMAWKDEEDLNKTIQMLSSAKERVVNV